MGLAGEGRTFWVSAPSNRGPHSAIWEGRRRRSLRIIVGGVSVRVPGRLQIGVVD